jgi:hypothetical protein
LLAAWMLVASTVMSSTYVHSHDEGSLAHNHDGHHSDLSTSTSIVHHDSCEDDLILSAVDSHQHGCLVLLGTITYQSTPEKSSNSEEKHPFGWETIIAASAAQNVRFLARSLAPDYSEMSSPAVLSIGCVCEIKLLGHSCNKTAPVIFLCDRARHERSGVLLA